MTNTLDTGIFNVRNVSGYIFGAGTVGKLVDIVSERRSSSDSWIVFLIDEYFSHDKKQLRSLPYESGDQLIYISTVEEPTTQFIDQLCTQVLNSNGTLPCAIVSIGGGITLDCGKAIANLLTNGGRAADYQGWDLVKVPGIYKIGVPTLSGTGAESTRTCVLTNKASGLKMGMNSDHTIFDQLILDPNLTKTVPRDQYFYTGMDAWIHCFEALSGAYRNPIGDAFSTQAISLCRDVFHSDNMMTDINRAKLMVASYLGGCAIATSYVGIVHPFSAGLSVVLGTHHCLANCITMGSMESFYPNEYNEFMTMAKKQDIEIPHGICADLSNEQYRALYQSSIVHEKPLTNALGKYFRDVLTEDRVKELFERM
jgi:3-deoxy-alpha-D-manno-octulosonate 8-oxidase